MATTEFPVKVEKDDTPQPFSKNFDQYGNSSGFIFDVSLSTAVAADGKNEERASKPKGPLSPEMLDKMNRYWRAANYLCIGQIYLFEHPLLRSPLKAEQIKPRLLGHWGTSPGQNFIYIHLNRMIKEHNADIIYISGPGHGGPSLNACSYLEGSYTEVHPEITHDEDGCGSCSANSRLRAACPATAALMSQIPCTKARAWLLAGSRIRRRFRQSGPDCGLRHRGWRVRDLPARRKLEVSQLRQSGSRRRGAADPSPHGYKISGPTAQGRTSDEDLKALYVGRGYKPYFVEGDDPEVVHQLLAQALEDCYAEIRGIQQEARKSGFKNQPVWPMIIFRTPKGWTCPRKWMEFPSKAHSARTRFRSHRLKTILNT